jgi:DNA-binding MarR family transcriptional regulator
MGGDDASLGIPGESILALPGEIDLDVLDVTLSFYLRGLSMAVSRDWESRLDGLDPIRGTGKVTALFLIANHPGIRPSVIAQVSLRDRSEIGRVLDGLEANGFITRRTSTQDSRAWALFLTEEGERIVAELRRRVRESREFFGDVSEEDYTQVIALLRKIYWRIVTEPRPIGRPQE